MSNCVYKYTKDWMSDSGQKSEQIIVDLMSKKALKSICEDIPR